MVAEILDSLSLTSVLFGTISELICTVSELGTCIHCAVVDAVSIEMNYFCH